MYGAITAEETKVTVRLDLGDRYCQWATDTASSACWTNPARTRRRAVATT